MNSNRRIYVWFKDSLAEQICTLAWSFEAAKTLNLSLNNITILKNVPYLNRFYNFRTTSILFNYLDFSDSNISIIDVNNQKYSKIPSLNTLLSYLTHDSFKQAHIACLEVFFNGQDILLCNPRCFVEELGLTSQILVDTNQQGIDYRHKSYYMNPNSEYYLFSKQLTDWDKFLHLKRNKIKFCNLQEFETNKNNIKDINEREALVFEFLSQDYYDVCKTKLNTQLDYVSKLRNKKLYIFIDNKYVSDRERILELIHNSNDVVLDIVPLDENERLWAYDRGSSIEENRIQNKIIFQSYYNIANCKSIKHIVPNVLSSSVFIQLLRSQIYVK